MHFSHLWSNIDILANHCCFILNKSFQKWSARFSGERHSVPSATLKTVNTLDILATSSGMFIVLAKHTVSWADNFLSLYRFRQEDFVTICSPVPPLSAGMLQWHQRSLAYQAGTFSVHHYPVSSVLSWLVLQWLGHHQTADETETHQHVSIFSMSSLLFIFLEQYQAHNSSNVTHFIIQLWIWLKWSQENLKDLNRIKPGNVAELV